MVTFDLAVLHDFFITQYHCMFAVFSFFSRLPVWSIREVTMRSKEMHIGTAVAMFHDVNVSHLVKLHGDVRSLERTRLARTREWVA